MLPEVWARDTRAFVEPGRTDPELEWMRAEFGAGRARTARWALGLAVAAAVAGAAWWMVRALAGPPAPPNAMVEAKER
jgi:hypothetical protein